MNRVGKQNSMCVALIACAFTLANAASAAQGGDSKHLINVPMTRQSTDYSCGAAALQSVLGFYGADVREGEVMQACKTNTTEGTAYKKIAEYARKQGHKVDISTNLTIEQLRKKIDQGTPVICLLQAWSEKKVDYSKDWKDGHYAVAIGYDTNNIYFMDPSTLGTYTFIPNKEFLDRWHDKDSKETLHHFGMTITKGKSSYSPMQFKKMD